MEPNDLVSFKYVSFFSWQNKLGIFRKYASVEAVILFRKAIQKLI